MPRSEKAPGTLCKLVVFATHPIQYQVPIWRALSSTPGLDLKVFYFSDHSVRGGLDDGFGVPVAWDQPMLDGYSFKFLARDADLSNPASVRIPQPKGLLSSLRPDWVLIHGYTHGFERQVARAAKRLGFQVMIRGEFSENRPRRSRLKRIARELYLRWFYRHIDAFCYVGEMARQHLLDQGISREKLCFSPYCVDNLFFKRQISRLNRKECRAQLGFSPSDFVVLFSGKLIPRKQPLLLIEAVSRAQKQRQDQLKLLMVGDGALRQQVNDLGNAKLGNTFRSFGFVNQSKLGPFFMAADAFVLPSTFETWGLVVNEAMLFGLPVIVSDQVGCRWDLVTERETGLVFPMGNIEELTKALIWLEKHRAKAETMGISARERVEGYSVAASVGGIVQALSIGC